MIILDFSNIKYCIGLPKMHGRIHIGPPKINGRIRIGIPSARTVPYWPTSGLPSNLSPLDFHSRGIPVYHSYFARKAPKCSI